MEITDKSIAIEECELGNSTTKIALIIGGEIKGVRSEFLQAADKTLHIELFGNNSSINVTTAAAIALHKISTHLNAHSKI